MARKAPTEPTPTEETPARRGTGTPADLFRLEGTYERLRRALLQGPADGRLEQPLSFWVLPNDRRLPIAFLDRPLNELLQTPLVDLLQTPGVGRKKILGYFDLLRRAVKDRSPQEPFGLPTSNQATDPAARRGAGVVWEAGCVSESVWSDWCETIRRAGFADQPLGRVAPSLKPLPTVIWDTPLGEYAEQSLAKIRTRKTHGEKRVNAIIQVFAAVHEAVSTAALDEQLQLDLRPRFVRPLVDWLLNENARSTPLSVGEVRDHLAAPLIRQIKIDLGSEVARLVSERLGLDGTAPPVKQQAERLKVTRARVYQMLEDCARVIAVRWPEGRWLLPALRTRPASPVTEGPNAKELVAGVQAILFPGQ